MAMTLARLHVIVAMATSGEFKDLPFIYHYAKLQTYSYYYALY